MRTTNLKNLLAVSILLLTTVFTTFPALADVYITAALVGETNKVAIKPDSTSEPNQVRAFAFDVRPDKNANTTEVTDTNECMKDTAPEYSEWDSWGRPECWCYRKQCRGDINGTTFLGKPITLADLSFFKMPFGVPDTYLATIPNGICADLNHAAFLGKRITLADLNIFKAYFNLPDANVPCCNNDGDCVLTIDDHYNYWTN
jgi:hypothetical protein